MKNPAWLPFLPGVIIMIIWTGMYLLFEKFHGMPEMFHSGYPVVVMKLVGLHTVASSGLVRALFVAIDGVLIGLLVSLIFRQALRLMIPR